MAVIDMNALNSSWHPEHITFLSLEKHLAAQIYQIGSHTGCPLEAAEFGVQLLHCQRSTPKEGKVGLMSQRMAWRVQRSPASSFFPSQYMTAIYVGNTMNLRTSRQ